MALPELLFDTFQGREDVYARATDKGFAPVREPLTVEVIRDVHLSGTRAIGCYTLRSDNMVRWCCFDFDNKPHNPDPNWWEKAVKLRRYLTGRGIDSLLEISQSGSGAHVWLFFEDWLPAATVRAWAADAQRDCGVTCHEIYPRQDKLNVDAETGEIGLGNQVRLPLWNQSRFVDDDGETIDPLKAFSNVKRVPTEQLKAIKVEQPSTPTIEGLSPRVSKRVSRSGTKLAKRWAGDGEGLRDPSNSGIALSIAVLLVREFVPTEEIKAALRHWLAMRGCDKGQRDDWIELTIKRAYEFVAKNPPPQRVDDDELIEPISYPLMSCPVLGKTDFDVEYLIDRFLVKGQPCIVGGGHKTLKTTLLLALGIALATGNKFLGRMFVNRICRVAIMSGESGMATIKETLIRIAKALGITLADIPHLLIGDTLPKFGSTRHAGALHKCLSENKIEVLGIDPAYLSMPGTDSANVFSQGELLREMNDVCQDLGVTMILCHHTRKDAVYSKDPPELADLAMAGFSEWARQWILVGRRKKFVPGSGLHKLWLNAGGSAGHSELWHLDIDEGIYVPGEPRKWDVSISTHAEAIAKERDMKRAMQASEVMADQECFRQLLARAEDGETFTGIQTLTGIRGKRAATALTALLDSREVERCRVRKPNGQSYDGYCLAT